VGSLNFNSFSSAGYFTKKTDGSTYILPGFWTGPAALLDVHNGDAQTAFWKTYQKHTDEGVSGWWCDLGEPESHPADMMHVNGPANINHNGYSFIWARMLSDHFTEGYPGRRLFHLFRSGYAGAQRWGLIPWSGDVKKSWSGLQAQIPIMLNSGMSGLAYMHGDAGGFDGSNIDEGLYTRWLQFAAFTPVMRAHGIETVPTEPVYYSQATQDIVRNFINLRYSLLPYTYTMMYENSKTGRPLARPMFYNEPGNASTNNIFNQYYWGKNMIVAPVTDPVASNLLVYAPAGKWYDYFNRQWIDGGSDSRINTPIENLALLIRGNSFIPFLKPKMSTDFMGMDSIYITYFNSNQNQASSDIIYEDDTAARDPLSTNKYSIMSLSSQGFQTTDDLEILLRDSVSNDWPGKKSLHFMEFTVTDMRKNYNVVTVNGIKLSPAYSMQSFNARDSAFYYDFAIQRLLLHFSWQESSLATIHIAYDPSQPAGPKNIFPNPTTGDLYVPLQLDVAGQYQFSLIDMQGRTLGTLATMNLPAGYTTVYLLLPSTLSTGTYLLYITGENYKKVEQVMKK
jgi:oligosaccharide 4-alpha-D-glucosyltransferase